MPILFNLLLLILLFALLGWAKKKGAKNVRVAASAGNQKAISFYRKHGFKDYELILEINFTSAAVSGNRRKKKLSSLLYFYFYPLPCPGHKNPRNPGQF